MAGAYYNENDPFAAAWLRELIKSDLIAPGEVDERSIEEVEPDDLRGFTQCHFFAGIGVWSHALRAAGWSDAAPVWTGSCPCQGFSASGQRGGFSDKRHLWPAWFRLIRERKPVTVFGEQVASKDGLAWLDVVSADMEAEGYAIGATDICAAGLGAPHIRQRLYFVAESQSGRHLQREYRDEARAECTSLSGGQDEGRRRFDASDGGIVDGMAHTERQQFRAGGSGSAEPTPRTVQGKDRERERLRDDIGERGAPCDMDQPDSSGSQQGRETAAAVGYGRPTITASGISDLGQPEVNGRIGRKNNGDTGRRQCASRSAGETSGVVHAERGRRIGREDFTEPPERRNGDIFESASEKLTNGFWRDAEWIFCRDEKWRPVEPGSFPLVNGTPNRVGRLRGYGNAINAEVAKAFIETYMSVLGN